MKSFGILNRKRMWRRKMFFLFWVLSASLVLHDVRQVIEEKQSHGNFIRMGGSKK